MPPSCDTQKMVNGKICYVYFAIKQEKHDRISQQSADGEARLRSLFALFLQRNGNEEHTL